jgi:hypothetical protein
MNSTNITISTNDNFEIFIENLSSKIKIIIAIIGLLACFICIIIFSTIIRSSQTNNKMFHYLLMKSICDFCYYLIYIIDIFFLCSSCELIKSTYFMQIFDKYFVHLMKQIFEMCTAFFEIFATIDCLISIKNKYTFFSSRKVFFISSFLNFFIVILLYFEKIFLYRIVSIKNSPDHYKTVKTDFFNSVFFRITTVLYSVIRDSVCSILLVFFNILIFIEIKKSANRKSRLSRSHSSKAVAFKAKSRKFKMILYTALSYSLLHTIASIKTTYGKFHQTDTFWYCFNTFEGNAVLLSYLVPFFLYIHFNNIFKKKLVDLIKCKFIS